MGGAESDIVVAAIASVAKQDAANSPSANAAGEADSAANRRFNRSRSRLPFFFFFCGALVSLLPFTLDSSVDRLVVLLLRVERAVAAGEKSADAAATIGGGEGEEGGDAAVCVLVSTSLVICCSGTTIAFVAERCACKQRVTVGRFDEAAGALDSASAML